MQVAVVNEVAIHWREDGDPAGVPVVFANSLGTDLRLIRFDKRGHGVSQSPIGAYAVDDLVTDAEGLLDHLGVRDFEDEAQANVEDPVLNIIEWERRRATLIAKRSEQDGKIVYRFEVKLQGQDETVFFDI